MPLAWLLSNWRLIAYGIGFLTVFGLGWHTKGIIAEHSLKSALQAQEMILVAKCEADKKITMEASHDYQVKLSNRDKQLTSLKRLHASSCVPIASAPPGYNASPGTGVDARSYGIAAESLLDFAGDAEKYRLQVTACQDFVKRVWER